MKTKTKRGAASGSLDRMVRWLALLWHETMYRLKRERAKPVWGYHEIEKGKIRGAMLHEKLQRAIKREATYPIKSGETNMQNKTSEQPRDPAASGSSASDDSASLRWKCFCCDLVTDDCIALIHHEREEHPNEYYAAMVNESLGV